MWGKNVNAKGTVKGCEVTVEVNVPENISIGSPWGNKSFYFNDVKSDYIAIKDLCKQYHNFHYTHVNNSYLYHIGKENVLRIIFLAKDKEEVVKFLEVCEEFVPLLKEWHEKCTRFFLDLKQKEHESLEEFSSLANLINLLSKKD